jgi:hypothetical protein
MRHNQIPWEHGSDFHLPDLPLEGCNGLPKDAHFYGSGRDALRALMRFGLDEHGWQVLWAPSYFCQTVLRDIRLAGLEIRTYSDNLWHDQDEPEEIHADRRGALMTMNPFGLRSKNRPLQFDRGRVCLIEDHTHDPWSPLVINSRADYCIVSLRKTVPIPDGGAAWSPVGREMPICPDPTRERMAASLQKHAGMVLKSLYLQGLEEDKPLFRRFLIQGELEMSAGPVSGMPAYTRAMLGHFPAEDWRRRRKVNFERLASRVESISGIQVLGPQGPDAVPFAAVLIASSQALRDQLRSGLTAAGIYPAVLWDLELPEVDGISVDDLSLSRRMLCLHCDARYTESDMDRVANHIKAILET